MLFVIVTEKRLTQVRMSGSSPEEAPDAQAILNGHYNHIFMS